MTGKTNTVKAYNSAIDIVLNFDSNVVSTSLEPSRKIRFQVLKMNTDLWTTNVNTNRSLNYRF